MIPAAENDIPLMLRSARISCGYSQSEAARLAGLTQPRLSMIENGKRRLTAKTAARLCEIYGIENGSRCAEACAYTDNTAVGVLKMLADKCGGGMSESAADYITIAAYLYIRELYLANPHNTERIFSISSEELERLRELVFSEPFKAAAFAKNSQEANKTQIEPSQAELPDFLSAIRACEQAALKLLGSGE